MFRWGPKHRDLSGTHPTDIQQYFTLETLRTRSFSRDKMAPEPATGDIHQIGSLHSLPHAADRDPPVLSSSLSGIPMLLREDLSDGPDQPSMPATFTDHGALSAPSTHAVLSPAEMSAILLSLPTRQDMENIATRMVSFLR